MLYVSMGYPLLAKLFPIISGLPAALLLMAQIVVDVRETGEQRRNSHNKGLTSELVPVLYYVMFIFVSYVLGFFVGLPLIGLVFLRFYAKYSWTRSLLLAALLGAIVLVFSFAFPLWNGFLSS